LIPANRSLTREDWREIIQRFTEASGLEVFVAADNQQPPIIVGVVALSVVRGLTEGRGLINDLAVLPTYRRRGIGTALLETAMKRAERLNLHHLMVNAQRADEQARAFYTALGFDSGDILNLKLR
jgi:ribosomal protein S18 acetylase RimI-like enzyme